MKNALLRRALFMIAGIFFCVNMISAQATEKIHRVEYFFDSDPGFGNGTTVNIIPAVTTVTNFNFTANIASLARGLHMLYVRTLDSAYRWSNTIPKLVYKETLLSNAVPNAVAAEYFFDTDPGVGNATPAAVTASQTVSFSINGNITALTKGLHNLYIRIKDAGGNWSHTTQQVFYKELSAASPIPNVVAAEYFFDADPGFGNGITTPVTANQVVNFSVNGNIGALSAGLHQLYVRTRDANGKWGLTSSQTFYKEAYNSSAIPNVVAAEYFFDTDPGFGNALSTPVVAGQTVNFNVNGNIAALSAGLHQLYVRTKDANGKWGITSSQLFYKEAINSIPVPNVVAAEYFFDTDPGFGNGTNTAVVAGQTVNFNINGSIAALSRGLHQLYVRTKDAIGRWSITSSQVFYKETVNSNPVPNVVAAEYFFDSDPGFGNATGATLTAGQLVTFNFAGNITALSNGLHQLYVRTRDANGRWSLSAPQLFYKEPVVNNPVPNIVAAEYYIDSDPGFGNATAFTVLPQAQTIIQNVSIPATALTRGLHRMYTRVKDANGKWSLTNTLLFYYETITPVDPATDLLVLEWFWNTDPGFGNANRVTLPVGNNGQVSSFVFTPNVNGFTNTKQNLFIRILDTDWSLTTVRMVDFTGIVVPITLLEFTAQARQDHVITKWTTSQELNSSHFDVEHSTDGINFVKFGTIAARGNSNVNTDYQLLHNDPVIGINYYRLKQVDIDGSYKYGPVVKVLFSGGKAAIIAFPNPVSDKLTVSIPAALLGDGLVLQLFDGKGAVVLQTNTQGRNNEINVSKFASGNYILILKNKSGVTIGQQNIIKL